MTPTPRKPVFIGSTKVKIKIGDTDDGRRLTATSEEGGTQCWDAAWAAIPRGWKRDWSRECRVVTRGVSIPIKRSLK